MREDAPPTCPHCGQPRPAAAPAGLCPRCLLANALGEAGGDTDSFTPEPWGPVLETLAATAGPMPRILLPDTRLEAGGVPLIRPASPEMPAHADRPSRVQLLGEIARGGMGVILKGRDPDLGRDLAVKVLRESHRDHPEMIRRFVEEAQIAGQLQHPGIVPVYELGCFADDRPYFTMKLVKGRTLAQLLADGPTAGAGRSRLLGIFEQMAQTVAYAHSRGVIHRDLKPSNVMVGAFGEVQVMDWGLAKVMHRGGAADDATAGRADAPGQETFIATSRGDSDSDLSRAGSVLGTPSYMAPEQARGEVEAVDERADVFALGSILCEMLTGQPAFTGQSSGEIHRKASRGELADATARLAACGADAELLTLANDCLAAKAADRPQDAGAVTVRFSAYLAGVQERLHAAELARAAEAARAEEATRTASAAQAQALAERKSRRLTVALAAAVVGMVALGGGGVAWLQHQRASRASATARVVNDALAESMRLEGEALAWGANDTARWDTAITEARRADDLLGQGEADAALRDRVASMLSHLKRRRDTAAEISHQAKVDRELLAALGLARNPNNPLESTERDYDAAFRAAGLDVDRNDPKAVGAWIAARSSPIELAAYLDDWAHIRRYSAAGAGKRSWTHLNAAARAADPDPWRDTLRAGLADDPAALRALADDEKGLESRSVVSLNLLAMTLWNSPEDRDRAQRVMRLAWWKFPDDLWTNRHILIMLEEQKPTSPEMLVRLREDRLRYQSILFAVRPDATNIVGSADAMRDLGRVEEAIAAYRESIRRHPDEQRARTQLASLLQERGETAEGLSLHREAANLGGGPVAYYYLGIALERQGEVEEALAAWREAIRLDGKHVGEAVFSLEHVLRKLGRYDEAAETCLRARELAEAEGQPKQAERAARELEWTQSQKALASRLPAILRGDDRPRGRGTGELEGLRTVCYDRQFFASGARIFDDALKADPELADDPGNIFRLNAVTFAALAGSGRGVDDPAPDEAEKARLRAQALSWLRAEVVAWSRRLEGATEADRAKIASTLHDWKSDPNLAFVRLPITLAKLPGPEREAWQALWVEVDAITANAQGRRP